jgi:hypothetical protein
MKKIAMLLFLINPPACVFIVVSSAGNADLLAAGVLLLYLLMAGFLLIYDQAQLAYKDHLDWQKIQLSSHLSYIEEQVAEWQIVRRLNTYAQRAKIAPENN